MARLDSGSGAELVFSSFMTSGCCISWFDVNCLVAEGGEAFFVVALVDEEETAMLCTSGDILVPRTRSSKVVRSIHSRCTVSCNSIISCTATHLINAHLGLCEGYMDHGARAFTVPTSPHDDRQG